MNMFALAVILAFSIFSSTSGNPVEKKARAHDINVEVALSSAMNQFGWDLYQELKNTSKNFAFSPLSVDLGAFILWAAVHGESKKQLRDALHLSDKYDDDTWIYGYDDLLNDLEVMARLAYVCINKHGNYAHDIKKEGKNSTWGLVDEVLGWLDSNVEKVNDFVANGTNYRIQNFIDSFKWFDLGIYINAAHFDGYWKSPFDPSETHSAPFQTSTGDNVTVQMMVQKGNFPYFDYGAFQVLKLNYQHGFSMILILPQAFGGLNELEDALSNADWEAIYKALEENPTDVAVSLPKFSFESKFELSGPLQQLGIHNVLTPGADPDYTYIRRYLHQTVVNVTETGTEAAAAAGDVRNISPKIRSGDAVSFTANHPFIFVIRDDTLKTNLLVGRFEEP